MSLSSASPAIVREEEKCWSINIHNPTHTYTHTETDTYRLRVFKSMQVQIVIHGGLIIQSTFSQCKKVNPLQKPQLGFKNAGKGLDGVAYSLPRQFSVDFPPAELLFIHIIEVKVIPRGNPDLALLSASQIRSMKAKAFFPQPRTDDNVGGETRDWLSGSASVNSQSILFDSG